MQKTTFGAGCFWGVQYNFDKVKGVLKTTVGYTGGKTKNPTYKEVCKGDTNHVESIEIEFDENIVSYKELLNIFWENHNPTTPNRQGPDIGYQYRSVIFYHNEEQKQIAEESKEEYQKKLEKKIVTVIEPAKIFYEAEDYHQKYHEKQGGTC